MTRSSQKAHCYHTRKGREKNETSATIHVQYPIDNVAATSTNYVRSQEDTNLFPPSLPPIPNVVGPFYYEGCAISIILRYRTTWRDHSMNFLPDFFALSSLTARGASLHM